jgi:hypothetical protein
LETFLLTYRATPSSSLPQHYPAELFFELKFQATLDLLLPTKQPTGRGLKIERQFNHRMERSLATLTGRICAFRYRQSHDWKVGSVAKRISDRLYDITLANESTRRFHANQMRLRSTQLTDDDLTAFSYSFNLPVRRRKLPKETLDTWRNLVDHNQMTSIQGNPAVDDVEPEQSSNAFSEPRPSKRGHIPKKQFEFDPRKLTSIHKLISGL